MDTEDLASIAPLEGLEIDAPPADSVELGARSSQARLTEREGSLELTIDEEAVSELGLVDSEPRVSRLADSAFTTDSEPTELGADLGLDLDEVPSEPEAAPASDDIGLELLDEEVEGAPRPSLAYLSAEAPPTPTLSDLEERVFDDPDDPETHRALGEALIASGESERGAGELDLAIAAYEAREDWQHAVDVVHELTRLEPNAVRHYQKMVELAYRTGDRGRLLDSYLELADGLMRAGAMDKALAVYRRVLEHDTGNQRALVALQTLAPVEEVEPPPEPGPQPAPAPREAPAAAKPAAASTPPPGPVAPASKPRRPAADGDFIDLGALILEESGPRDTRMRVEDEEPTGDEQHDFNEMLSQFKRGIDENIDAEDFQSHYDLGVAFKEMGLLDEAIAEFQKALRVPGGTAADLGGAGRRVLRQGAVRDRGGDSPPGGGEPGRLGRRRRSA